MMYKVRMRINGFKCMDLVTGIDFKSIYMTGKRAVKLGKHDNVDINYRVSDPDTGKTILFMYSRNKSDGTTVARQTHVGKWKTGIDF